MYEQQKPKVNNCRQAVEESLWRTEVIAKEVVWETELWGKQLLKKL